MQELFRDQRRMVEERQVLIRSEIQQRLEICAKTIEEGGLGSLLEATCDGGKVALKMTRSTGAHSRGLVFRLRDR